MSLLSQVEMLLLTILCLSPRTPPFQSSSHLEAFLLFFLFCCSRFFFLWKEQVKWNRNHRAPGAAAIKKSIDTWVHTLNLSGFVRKTSSLFLAQLQLTGALLVFLGPVGLLLPAERERAGKSASPPNKLLLHLSQHENIHHVKPKNPRQRNSPAFHS